MYRFNNELFNFEKKYIFKKHEFESHDFNFNLLKLIELNIKGDVTVGYFIFQDIFNQDI